jgi:hypothetical protein
MSQLSLPPLILTLLQHGITVELLQCKDESILFNVNTGAKSHLHLKLNDDDQTFTGLGRYGDEYGHIQTLDDVCSAVHSCMCSRPSVSEPWKQLLLDKCYIKEVVERTLIV